VLLSAEHVTIVATILHKCAFMTEPFSHRRHPVNMLASAHVKTEPLKSVHYSTNVQAVGLLSVAAILSLIMWYIFSFLTLFMNKYTLDALQAEPFLFCEYQRLVTFRFLLCYFIYYLAFNQSFGQNTFI